MKDIYIHNIFDHQFYRLIIINEMEKKSLDTFNLTSIVFYLEFHKNFQTILLGNIKRWNKRQKKTLS